MREESEVSSASDCRNGGVFFRCGFLIGGSSDTVVAGDIDFLYSLSPWKELALAECSASGEEIVLLGECRELIGGLAKPLSDDVPEEDAEVGLAGGSLIPAAMGETARRFKGITLLGAPLSESLSER